MEMKGKNDGIRAFKPNSKHLTHNKYYIIEWVSCGGYIAVRNDAGKIKPYAPRNFTKKEKKKLYDHPAYPNLGVHKSERDHIYLCDQCGQPLTLVRPGKYQCDNKDCPTNKT